MRRFVSRSTLIGANAANRRPFERPANMNPLVYDVLISRGIASAEEARKFLYPSLDDLNDPYQLSDMAEAVATIRRHLDMGSPITVYGDYDVDGVTASSILYTHLISLGANAEVYLPSRHNEGYGLNDAAITEIAGRSRLLITVDCGISNAAQIALARQLGLDCVVTDHHRPPEQLPDCPTVNPLLNDYPFPSLCGAGVAFQLVRALSGNDAAVRLIDLAAIGTIADLVPLQDENRIITHFGLAAINRQSRLGVGALISAAGLAGKPIRAHHIAFQLAPRLNASGRIGSAKIAFELLTSHDEAQAQELALFLNRENDQRKQLEQQIIAEADELLKDYDFQRNHVIAIVGEGWNEGVIGLAASRLLERYHMPVMVFSRTQDTLVGSCRSIDAVNIHAVLTSCADLFTRFGGHKAAAGLTLPAENFDRMLERINRYIEQNCDAAGYTPVSVYDCQPNLSELTLESMHALECFQPTGMGNPTPLFLAEGEMTNWRTIGADNKHLKFELACNGRHDCIAFGMVPLLHKPVGGTYRVIFSPKENTYAGRTTIQLEIKAMQQSGDAARQNEVLRGTSRLQMKFVSDLLSRKIPEKSPQETGTRLSRAELIDILTRTTQGTLVLCGSAATAYDLIRDCGSIHELYVNAYPQEALGHNAICLLPCGELPRFNYSRVVLVDLPPQLFPFAGAQSVITDAAGWLHQLPDIAALRSIYAAARKLLGIDARSLDHLIHAIAGATRLSEACVLAGIAVYCDLKLLTYTDSAMPKIAMAPMQKTDPESSAVYRLIRSAREWDSARRNDMTQTGGIPNG